MKDDKDMVEISLGADPVSDGRDKDTFGQLSLGRSKRDIPFGLHEDHFDEWESITEKQNDLLDNFDHTDANSNRHDDWQSSNLSSLRQIYCPNCQHRLEVPKRRYEKLSACCFPIFSIAGIYQFCQQRLRSPKIICNNCGSNLSARKRP